MLLKLGDTAAACEEWGIPLLAEMIPATSLEHHFGRQEAQDTGLFDSVSTVARMGAEYGGDLIKTIYSGNQQEFAKRGSQYHGAHPGRRAAKKRLRR